MDEHDANALEQRRAVVRVALAKSSGHGSGWNESCVTISLLGLWLKMLS